MKQLPDKLSDLIEVALKDLEACEKDPKYTVDMHKWHEPGPEGICSVCLAGAVIAKSLERDQTRDMHPGMFPDDDTNHKLSALNMVRRGYVDEAMYYLGKSYGGRAFYEIEPYSWDPEKFKQDLRKMIEGLREEGL